MQTRLIRILSLIKKEFLSIFKDPKSRALIITPPLLQLIVFANALTMEVKNIDISISHCKEYAVATVVAMVE